MSHYVNCEKLGVFKLRQKNMLSTDGFRQYTPEAKL